jgi:tetratricopeptide (TPR) repeat protein
MCACVPATQAEDAGTVVAKQEFEQAHARLLQADDARDSGKYAEARTLYENALVNYTAFARTYPAWQPRIVEFRMSYCKGQVEALSNRVDVASGTAPVEKAPLEANAPVVMAKEALHNGKPEQARALLLGAMQSRPDDHAIRLLLGYAQCQSGNYPDAQSVADGMLADDPADSQAHLLLALSQFGMGRTPVAIQSARRAIEINPDFTEAHYDMAQMLLSSETPDAGAADSYYRKYIQLGGTADTNMEHRLKKTK